MIYMDNSQEISVFINAVRDLCGVGICYYDLSDFFHYDKFGVKNNRGHYCAFCEKTRSFPKGRDCCNKSDKDDALQLAKEYGTPFFFECHMGMKELVVPVLKEQELIGVLFVGQCRIQGDNHTAAVTKGAQRLGGKPKEMLALYEQLPIKSQDDLLNIGQILSQYFNSKVLTNQLLTPEIAQPDKELAYLMQDYIHANYSYNITPKSIAEKFYVNPSYASRCFSEKHGVTLTEYISRVRMERAMLLLKLSMTPVSNIALNVGYADVNYFSRVFKKTVGMTPTAYRNTYYKKA